MVERSGKAEEILDAAERQARSRGFNGFSFRDLAEAVEVKSASVHYHFPTKADLGAAVVARYRERFLAALGDPESPGSLERYVAAYRKALVEDGQMCLCGLFGAEIEALPGEVALEVRRFFQDNLAWLERALAPAGPDQAVLVLSALEGALILARSLERTEAFDQAAAALLVKH
ncbi:MAG: TetR/AcrR family transcriptional regulator [Pseudomonadota bacterium]